MSLHLLILLLVTVKSLTVPTLKSDFIIGLYAQENTVFVGLGMTRGFRLPLGGPGLCPPAGEGGTTVKISKTVRLGKLIGILLDSLSLHVASKQRRLSPV